MHADLYGIQLETPQVTFYLWSPWRATALELRLFDSITSIAGVSVEKEADELRIHVRDIKTWKQALLHFCRVLKGWQEEASDAGRERRAWRWLLEGDVDDHGYDHAGEAAGLWAFLQLGLERGSFEEPEKTETIDLQAIGLKFWPTKEK